MEVVFEQAFKHKILLQIKLYNSRYNNPHMKKLLNKKWHSFKKKILLAELLKYRATLNKQLHLLL